MSTPPSIPDQIRALEALASIDAEIKTLGDEITQQKGVLTTLKVSLKKLEDKLATDRAHLATLDKAKNDVIADVRSMTQQLEHSREKMGRARTEREVNAAQRELEELRKLLRDREEELGKLTADGDAARMVIEAHLIAAARPLRHERIPGNYVFDTQRVEVFQQVAVIRSGEH